VISNSDDDFSYSYPINILGVFIFPFFKVTPVLLSNISYLGNYRKFTYDL